MGLATSGFGGLIRRIAQTEADLGAMIVRLTLGICMIPHGMQKLLGAFGGPGVTGTLNWFAAAPPDGLGVPKPVTFLVILAESFGGLGLILGVLSRFCAFGIGLVMVGAILMVHGKEGFFGPKGFEYNLALIGLSVAVMYKGSGAFSFDRWLTKPAEVMTP